MLHVRMMGKLFAAVSLVGLIVGCNGQKPVDVSELNKTNIAKLRNAYSIYMNQHQFTGPKNEKELKDFVKSDLTAKVLLERMGVKPDDIDGIFVSDRDGKPFKVRWGLLGMADFPIVFEAEGKDGKRMVAYATVKELSSAEAEKLYAEPVSKKFDHGGASQAQNNEPNEKPDGK
jgi:hypothetical protein